jgi:hypothetical protein
MRPILKTIYFRWVFNPVTKDKTSVDISRKPELNPRPGVMSVLWLLVLLDSRQRQAAVVLSPSECEVALVPLLCGL